jgi:hypothetical protein
LPHVVIFWLKDGSPLEAKGALSVAIDADLMRPIVDAAVTAAIAQTERDVTGPSPLAPQTLAAARHAPGDNSLLRALYERLRSYLGIS